LKPQVVIAAGGDPFVAQVATPQVRSALESQAATGGDPFGLAAAIAAGGDPLSAAGAWLPIGDDPFIAVRYCRRCRRPSQALIRLWSQQRCHGQGGCGDPNR
jgi:hypothetical protein